MVFFYIMIRLSKGLQSIWLRKFAHNEKADLFLAKAIAIAISVHFRHLSMRPAIPINI